MLEYFSNLHPIYQALIATLFTCFMTALALGIGIQNVPEGTAVPVALSREGFSRLKAFWYGQLS
jgi:zinc transporter ZupT